MAWFSIDLLKNPLVILTILILCIAIAGMIIRLPRGSQITYLLSSTEEHASASSVQSPLHSAYSFIGSQLNLENLYANVRVVPHTQEEQQIIVEIEGSSTMVEQITAHQIDTIVKVSGKQRKGMVFGGGRNRIGENSIISANGQTWVNGQLVNTGRWNNRGITVVNKNGRTWVNGQLIKRRSDDEDVQEPVEITVKVPRRTPLVIEQIDGDVEIGDVAGYVDVNVNNSGNVMIASAVGGSVQIQGSGDCTIDHFSGSELDLMIQGSGDIRVCSGNVDILQGSVSGSGDIYCDQLVAHNASLSISGSGDIYVYHVTNQLSRSVTGSGDISIEYQG